MDEEKATLEELKNKYAEFYKSATRILFSDPEIILMDYFLSRFLTGKMELEENAIVEDLKIDKKTLSSSIHGLVKTKFIRLYQKIVSNVSKDMKSTKMKICYYTLNPNMKSEFEKLQKKIILEKDTFVDWECSVCKKHYRTDEVYHTNPILIYGRFRCLTCNNYLQDISEENKKKIQEKNEKKKMILQTLLNKFDNIRDTKWPWAQERAQVHEMDRNEENKEVLVEEKSEYLDLLSGGVKLKRLRSKIELNLEKMWRNLNLNEKVINFLKSRDKTQNCIVFNKMKRISKPVFLKNRRKLRSKSNMEYERIFKLRK